MDENESIRVADETLSLFKLKSRAVIRKWWLFIIVSALFGIAGFIYASKQKPMYKSRLTFALDDAGAGGGGGFASLASQFGLNVGGNTDVFSGDNIIEIIKSRRMIERVLLSPDSTNDLNGKPVKPRTLIDYYLDISDKRKEKEVFQNVIFPINQSRDSFSYIQDSVLNVVYNELVKNYLDAGKPDRRLNIFEINITSPDEKFSKLMTERLVNETNSFYVELRTKKAKSTLDALENRISAMKSGLNTSIRQRAVSKDLNLNPVFESAQVPVIQKQTEMEVYGAAYAEIFKNQEVARFQYLTNIPLLQIIDPVKFPMERIKASRLKYALLSTFIGNLLLLIILWIFISPAKLKTLSAE